jgi:hypothetical protein
VRLAGFGDATSPEGCRGGSLRVAVEAPGAREPLAAGPPRSPRGPEPSRTNEGERMVRKLWLWMAAAGVVLLVKRWLRDTDSVVPAREFD